MAHRISIAGMKRKETINSRRGVHITAAAREIRSVYTYIARAPYPV